MPRKLIVIGGDAAGMSAASNAKRREEDLEVVVLERGDYTSFSACGIPYYVGDWVHGLDELVSRTPQEHRDNDLDVRMRHEVLGIDLAARTVTVRDLDGGGESREGFDELVYATGAEAIRPPIDGADALEPVRTLAQGERFKEAIDGKRGPAVVVGGGYIGLEMAEALVHRGFDVTVVERSDHIFGTVDPEMADRIQVAAEGIGVRVLTGTSVDAIETTADGRPRAVSTSQGELRADHVVLGTGAKPAVGLAEAAGLTLGASGAVAVGADMRCPGHDGIWAAGDCAESTHRLTGEQVNIQLGTHANKQGRIAGVNIAGGDLRFPGVLGTAISRICHLEIARTGLGEAEAAEAGLDCATATVTANTHAGYWPERGDITIKLVAERGTGRLVGAQLVGEQTAGKRIDTLAMAVWTGMSVEELQWVDLSYAPPVSPTLDPVLVAARATAKQL